MYLKDCKLEIISADLFGGYANSYIIETDNRIFIIDANIASAKILFDKTLKDFSVDIKPISLLLTHGHWDHVGLAHYLKNKYKATIYANKDSEELMFDKNEQLNQLYDKYAPEYSFGESIKLIWKKDFINTIKPDKYLNDGDVFIDNDFILKVIKTPGHSNDELSFYNPTNDMIFTGDTLQGKGYNIHPALYTDPNKSKDSLNKILNLNPKTIYGGHFYINEPDTCRRYIKQSITFINEVDEFVRNNSNLEFNDLLQLFIKKYHYEYSTHAVITLKAHIK